MRWLGFSQTHRVLSDNQRPTKRQYRVRTCSLQECAVTRKGACSLSHHERAVSKLKITSTPTKAAFSNLL
jgi:hypothetical protein